MILKLLKNQINEAEEAGVENSASSIKTDKLTKHLDYPDKVRCLPWGICYAGLGSTTNRVVFFDKLSDRPYPFSVNNQQVLAEYRVSFLTKEDAENFNKVFPPPNKWYLPIKSKKLRTLVRIDIDGDVPCYYDEENLKKEFAASHKPYPEVIEKRLEAKAVDNPFDDNAAATTKAKNNADKKVELYTRLVDTLTKMGFEDIPSPEDLVNYIPHRMLGKLPLTKLSTFKPDSEFDSRVIYKDIYDSNKDAFICVYFIDRKTIRFQVLGGKSPAHIYSEWPKFMVSANKILEKNLKTLFNNLYSYYSNYAKDKPFIEKLFNNNLYRRFGSEVSVTEMQKYSIESMFKTEAANNTKFKLYSKTCDNNDYILYCYEESFNSLTYPIEYFLANDPLKLINIVLFRSCGIRKGNLLLDKLSNTRAVDLFAEIFDPKAMPEISKTELEKPVDIYLDN